MFCHYKSVMIISDYKVKVLLVGSHIFLDLFGFFYSE